MNHLHVMVNFGKCVLPGLCLLGGSAVWAGSKTIAGATGSNYTHLVIPEEYTGKEGQFVALASSGNTKQVTLGTPHNDGNFAYVSKKTVSYGTIEYTLESPSGSKTKGNNLNISSLEKGTYIVTIKQNVSTTEETYSLWSTRWASNIEKTYEEMSYYALNGVLPVDSEITWEPTRTVDDRSSSLVSTGVAITSAYIVVYGVEDETGGDPVPGGDSGNGDINIDISTGTDDGVYTLLDSLFSYISEIQTILSASDDAIRSELQSYIMELQAAYQRADSQLATTIQNQINALQSALSTSVADLRTSLENQIAVLQGQIGALQSEQSDLLSEFQTLKGELLTAISQNTGDIAALSRELAEKYEALVATNSNLKADLLAEIAEVTSNFKEADAALIADYSSKLASLQTLLQQADSALADNIAALQNAYQTADATLRENLEQQLAALRNEMSAEDQKTLDRITALQQEMSNADESLRDK